MIIEYLKNNGPSLSSEVRKHIESPNLSYDAAKKQISRACASRQVHRLDAVTFPNREKFLYLEKDYLSPHFKNNLIEALINTKTSYGQLIRAIRLRSGYLPLKQAPIYSGLATHITKGHILYSTALKRLKALNLIIEQDGYLQLAFEEPKPIEAESIEIVENIVLEVYKNWLTKTAFASFGKVKLRSLDLDQPKVGQFEWCLSAPSYTATIAKRTKTGPQPGFIAADIILGRKLDLADISYFINKWEAFSFQRKKVSFQPFLIADSVSPDALSELRKKGCILAFPEIFLGQEAAASLRELIPLIKNAAIAVTKDPDKVFEQLKRVAKLEGAANNLRGVIFEFIIAHLHTSDGYNIEMNETVYGSDHKPAEIDVVAKKKKKEIFFIECKGMSPGNLVNHEILNEWASRPLKRIKSWIKSESSTHPNKKEIHFYSSTGYSEDAQNLMEDLRTRSKLPVTFFDGTDVLRKLKEECDQPTIKIFKEQFLIK